MGMNPEVKALWLAALRSGEYQQDVGFLKTEHGFCPLGVLCEIAVKNGVIDAPVEARNEDGLMVWWYGGDGDGHGMGGVGGDLGKLCGELPESVMRWAGLESSVGYPPRDDAVSTGANILGGDRPSETWSLVEWNDDAGATFVEIADIVEAKF